MRSFKDEFGDPLYRPGIGMIIVNAEGKIFVGQRLDQTDPSWQMPQGGISPHEEPDQAMLRELQEEIGTRNVEIIIKSKRWYAYDLPESLAAKLWNGKYKGQRQLWYLLRFRGRDEEINIHTYHPEFRAWKWVDKEELVSLIVPFKRELYTCVLEDLWRSDQ